MRALGIRGCSVSMPFKEAVIPLVEELTASATAIDSVNTIVNDDGRLTAYNTDYEAVAELIGRHALDPAAPCCCAAPAGWPRRSSPRSATRASADLTVLARNAAAGRALADKYGYRWVQDDPAPADAIIVNVTPLGMNGPEADALAFPPSQIEAARAVFDVVASPAETPLDPRRPGGGQAGHHRRRGHRAAGRPPVRALHRGEHHRRAGRARVRLLPRELGFLPAASPPPASPPPGVPGPQRFCAQSRSQASWNQRPNSWAP